jgi:hypothetical protein
MGIFLPEKITPLPSGFSHTESSEKSKEGLEE